MPKYSITDYRDVGCKQFGDEIFMALYYKLNGNICPGCPWETTEPCKHQLELNAQKNMPKPKVTGELTNKQIATRLGISKRQVSKMKKDNPQELKRLLNKEV